MSRFGRSGCNSGDATPGAAPASDGSPDIAEGIELVSGARAGAGAGAVIGAMDDSGGVKGRATDVAAGAPLERLAYRSGLEFVFQRRAATRNGRVVLIGGVDGGGIRQAELCGANGRGSVAVPVCDIGDEGLGFGDALLPGAQQGCRPAAVLAQGDNAALSSSIRLGWR